MSRLRERLRWRLAYAVSRLPGTCWTKLVGYAMRDRRTPWQRQDDRGRRGAAETGSCYCGSIQDPAGFAAWRLRHPLPRPYCGTAGCVGDCPACAAVLQAELAAHGLPQMTTGEPP